MKAEWQLWADDSNRLAASTCAALVKTALEKITPQMAVVGENSIDIEKRRSEIRWIFPDTESFGDLFRLVDDRIHVANRNAFGVDLSYLHALQMTTYRAEWTGHYDWHMDTFLDDRARGVCLDRKLSATIQLSAPEDYDGGDFELKAVPPPAQEDLRRQGAMLVFPSFLQHRVTPVTRGIRHSIVAWYEGPLWR